MRHRGKVVQYLGDGLLALFGAQESSEYDAEEAIRGALEIQTSPMPLAGPHPVHVRVGIHTGPVVVGELGPDAHKEFTASGDAMNLASRLQSAAPPGGILISYDTYRYVRGVFDVTPQPPLAVKGKAEPIQTYLVRRAKPRAFRASTRGVTGIETRTVGREREFKALQETYLDAYEGRRVAWVQLVGEVGVGKSRLLQDLDDWIELRPETVRVFKARAFAGDENKPFAFVRRMWFDRFQIAEDTPLAQAEAKWVRAFQELWGHADEDSTERAIALGLLVGLPFRDSPYIGAMRNDPMQVKGRASVVTRELLGKIREDRLVVILLEDLQRADASSWEWLTEVVLGLENADRRRHEEALGTFVPMSETVSLGEAQRNGMFLLVTARPEWYTPEALTRLGLKGDEEASAPAGPPISASDRPATRYVHIDLTPLSDEAAGELARELLQRAEGVPEDVVRLLAERSEGVPYFAEEVVNWFVDRGIIDQSREPWRFVVGRLRGSPLPATLQHLLLTRLSSLSDVDRAALQRGAIFGRNFWTGGVEALGVRESMQVLAHLQLRGFVNLQPESSFGGEMEWSFYHNQLRDVTHESVLRRERGALHQKAAQWLEEQARRAGRVDEFAGLIGEHRERGGDLSAAAEWYIRAGESAHASSALAEARRFFDRALELLPPIDRERRWRALLGREAVLQMRGDHEAHRADLAALLELAEELDDDTRRAEAYFRQAWYLSWAPGEQRATLPAADQAIAAAQRTGILALEARAMAEGSPVDAAGGDGGGAAGCGGNAGACAGVGGRGGICVRHPARGSLLCGVG
jgi:predicted ATPase